MGIRRIDLEKAAKFFEVFEAELLSDSRVGKAWAEAFKAFESPTDADAPKEVEPPSRPTDAEVERASRAAAADEVWRDLVTRRVLSSSSH